MLRSFFEEPQSFSNEERRKEVFRRKLWHPLCCITNFQNPEFIKAPKVTILRFSAVETNFSVKNRDTPFAIPKNVKTKLF